MAPIDAWTKTLRDKWKSLGKESARAELPVVAPTTRLDWINWLTKYGLVVSGLCLMAGFLTRLAALYGAGFLILLYLAMPPWPGTPPAPGPGHDWIVNNQLIEALACLVAIREQAIPPTINLERPDPDCDLCHVPHQAIAHPVEYALSNSFGFGGSNTSLILRKAA